MESPPGVGLLCRDAEWAGAMLPEVLQTPISFFLAEHDYCVASCSMDIFDGAGGFSENCDTDGDEICRLAVVWHDCVLNV